MAFQGLFNPNATQGAKTPSARGSSGTISPKTSTKRFSGLFSQPKQKQVIDKNQEREKAISALPQKYQELARVSTIRQATPEEVEAREGSFDWGALRSQKIKPLAGGTPGYVNVSEPGAPAIGKFNKPDQGNFLSRAFKKGYNAISDSLTHASSGVVEAQEALAPILASDVEKSKKMSRAQKIGAGAKGVSGVAGLFFMPIAAELEAAKEIPVIKHPAKAADWAFKKLGDLGYMSSTAVINNLPISDESKEALHEPIGELASTLGMLLGAKALHAGTEKGGGKILEKAPISERAKASISTGVKMGSSLALSPIRAPFKLFSNMVAVKVQQRKADGIEVTPQEATKIVQEVKAENPQLKNLPTRPSETRQNAPGEEIVPETGKDPEQGESRQLPPEIKAEQPSETRGGLPDGYVMAKEFVNGDRVVARTPEGTQVEGIFKSEDRRSTTRPSRVVGGKTWIEEVNGTKHYFGDLPNQGLIEEVLGKATQGGEKVSPPLDTGPARRELPTVEPVKIKNETRIADVQKRIEDFEIGKQVSENYGTEMEQNYNAFKDRYLRFTMRPPEDPVQFKERVPEGKNMFYSQEMIESEVFDMFVDRIQREQKGRTEVAQLKNELREAKKDTFEDYSPEDIDRINNVISSMTESEATVGFYKRKKLQSRVFERMKAEHPEFLEGDLAYGEVKLKDDAQRALDLIAEDKQKAYRIAMEAETSSDVTSTAVNIAMSEIALADGNHSLYAQLMKTRSLAQTRRGQEIVAEKGSVTDNSTSKYVKELLSARLEKIGKNYLSGLRNTLKKTTNKKRATEIIDQKVAEAQKKVSGKELDIKEAQSIIDKLACA